MSGIVGGAGSKSGVIGRSALGFGQVWTNVTGSRSGDTTYTNSTPLPIFISIISTTGTAGDIKIEIGGVSPPASVYTNSSGGRNELSAVVPPGKTYLANIAGSASPVAWMELR